MKNKKVMFAFAKLVKNVAILANGATSFFDSYQPEEPESVRRMAEERRQAKLAKKASKK